MNQEPTRATPPVVPAPDETVDSVNTRPDLTGLPEIDPPTGYELLEVIGKGGMGVVFLARERAFDREVALKFLLGDPPDPVLAVRFLDEARITGQLQHPGVPAAYRTGVLADGRPYLAMKLIKGRTLDVLLAERRPGRADFAQWLGAFEGICQAVGYAHAHGVIHRDLKPANIMVGAFGEVQVMDWGLAKVIGTAGPDPTGGASSADPNVTQAQAIRAEGTRAGSVLGTPAYMPPEQASGDIDAVGQRSDVFGLGGILCVVLTGQAPYTAADARSTLALAARGELGATFARLDACGAEPDLVALCKRCLSADPADRPGDGSEVAAVVAGIRASAEDRARVAQVDRARAEAEAAGQRKRRRVVQWAAGAVVAVLVAGVIGTAIGLVRAEAARADADAARGEEKKRADSEAAAKELAEERRVAAEKATKLAQAETVRANLETQWASTTLEFLVRDLILQADAYQQIDREAINPNLTVREALDRAAGRITARTKDAPHIAPALRGPIGEAFVATGQFQRGAAMLEQAAAESTRFRGPTDRHTLELRRALAVAYQCDSKYDKAVPLYAEVVKLQAEAFGPDDRETLRTALRQAACLRESGKPADAVKVVDDAVPRARARFGPDDGLSLALQLEQASCNLLLDKLDRATELFGSVLAARRKKWGSDDLLTLEAVAWLGWCHNVARRPQLALPLFEEAVKGRRSLLGAEHPHTLLSLDNLGNAYLVTGRVGEAVPLLEEALRGRRKVLGPNNLKTFWSIGNLANAYTRSGRWREARELYTEGATRQRELFGADFPNRLVHLHNLAECELELAQPRRALAVLSETKGAWARRFGPGHQNELLTLSALARCHLDLGDPVAAAPLAAEAADGLARKFGGAHVAAIESRLLQAECELAAGKRADAKKSLAALLPVAQKALPVGGAEAAHLLATAGKFLVETGAATEAEPVLRESVRVLTQSQPKGWQTARATALLGAALLKQRRYAEAEPLLIAGFEGLASGDRSLPPREWNERGEVARALADLCAATGKPDAAREWRAKAPTELAPVPRPR